MLPSRGPGTFQYDLEPDACLFESSFCFVFAFTLCVGRRDVLEKKGLVGSPGAPGRPLVALIRKHPCCRCGCREMVQRFLPGAGNWRKLGFTFRQRVTFFACRTSSPSVVEENPWLPPTRGILEGGEPFQKWWRLLVAEDRKP